MLLTLEPPLAVGDRTSKGVLVVRHDNGVGVGVGGCARAALTRRCRSSTGRAGHGVLEGGKRYCLRVMGAVGREVRGKIVPAMVIEGIAVLVGVVGVGVGVVVVFQVGKVWPGVRANREIWRSDGVGHGGGRAGDEVRVRFRCGSFPESETLALEVVKNVAVAGRVLNG